MFPRAAAVIEHDAGDRSRARADAPFDAFDADVGDVDFERQREIGGQRERRVGTLHRDRQPVRAQSADIDVTREQSDDAPGQRHIVGLDFDVVATPCDARYADRRQQRAGRAFDGQPAFACADRARDRQIERLLRGQPSDTCAYRNGQHGADPAEVKHPPPSAQRCRRRSWRDRIPASRARSERKPDGEVHAHALRLLPVRDVHAEWSDGRAQPRRRRRSPRRDRNRAASRSALPASTNVASPQFSPIQRVDLDAGRPRSSGRRRWRRPVARRGCRTRSRAPSCRRRCGTGNSTECRRANRRAPRRRRRARTAWCCG